MKEYTIIYYETLGLTKIAHWMHVSTDNVETFLRKYDVAIIFEGHCSVVI